MPNETVDSMGNLCRACMTSVDTMKTNSRKRNHKQCITEKPAGYKQGPTILQQLQSVLPDINVEIDGILPKSMCVGCIQHLQLAYEFVEMFKDSDEKIRKLLQEVYLQVDASCQNELKDFSELSVEEQDPNDESQIKFEIAVENLDITTCGDALEIDDYQENEKQNFLEFEDDKPHYNNEEDNEECSGEIEIFVNPFSEASGDECTNVVACNIQLMKEASSPPKRRKTRDERCIKERPCAKLKPKPSKEQIQTKRLKPKQEDQSVTCEECDAVLENKKVWRLHMRTHHVNKSKKGKISNSKKPYKCEYCNKEFQLKPTLKNHIRTHTGEEPYLCIECGKGFKVASSLNTHMLRHRGEKTVQCPHCPKKFVCSSGLYGHMMVHTKEKPYVCDICGSAFHMKYMLRKHNLYHKDIRNFPCEYCDLRFVTAEKQRRHVRTHTGEKPYRCKYCDRAFAQTNDCNKHMKLHVGENIFQCELCPLRFPLVRDLRVHFATHKDDDEDTRARNLAAREADEVKLRIKLGINVDKSSSENLNFQYPKE